VIGVDTVGIAFPVSGGDDYGATLTVSAAHCDEEAVTFGRQLPGGGFLRWGLGGTAWAEASLPKRVGSDNVEGIPCEAFGELVADLHREACEYVQPCDGFIKFSGSGRKAVDGTDYRQAVIKRLDLVRDFDGVAIGPVLDGLARVRPGGRVKQRRYADGDNGAAETLRVGVKSAWSCVLYDKHAETGGLAPKGRLRFETRLREAFLTGRHGSDLAARPIHQVESFDQPDSSMVGERLVRDRFAAVGFDRAVVGTDALADALERSGFSPRRKQGLLAYLMALELGIDLGFHRNTIRGYRRDAEALGIVPGSVAPDIRLRLDLDSGTQQFITEHPDGDR
jgi:hypothetical protein